MKPDLFPAHLLLHLRDDRAPPQQPARERAWRWLRSWLHRPARACAGVEIDDLQGHRLFEADPAAPLMDVPLPAGTYHVTAHRGRQRRRYTVTLEHGAHFDLYLRVSGDRP